MLLTFLWSLEWGGVTIVVLGLGREAAEANYGNAMYNKVKVRRVLPAAQLFVCDTRSQGRLSVSKLAVMPCTTRSR